MGLLRTTWTDAVDGSGTTLNNAALQAIYDKVALSLPSICGGRLTLTSGSPVTTADVSAVTNVFYAPYVSAAIALYDGVSAWNVLSFAETTLALGTLTSGRPYDVFAYNNSSTLALELLAWTSDTARATALVYQDGVLVKSGATTRRYLGTFRTTSTTTTEDSFAKRFLWNYYNRVPRAMRAIETTDNWGYTTATFRQARATATNQLEFVIGVAEVLLRAEVSAHAFNSSTGVNVSVGIGEDSTSAVVAGTLMGFGTTQVANLTVPVSARLVKFPAIGYHFYAWLEFSVATGATTWLGDSGVAYVQAGIHGTIDG